MQSNMALNQKIKRVLVAEDEKSHSQALVLKLKNSGFDVTTVQDGEEAMKLIREQKFDFLTLDLMMPKMDGYAVLTEIKKGGIMLPTMVLSNLSQPEDEKRARDLGAVEFLNKANTSIADVVDKIKVLIGDKK